MTVRYENLAGTFPELVDAGLAVSALAPGPRVLVLGVSPQGQSLTPFVVGSTSQAAQEFGSDSTSTLPRGMYEVKNAGAQNVILYRLGATGATLTGIGDTTGVAGYTIETLRRDADAGDVYYLYYDDGTDRLMVFNNTSGDVVYDNSSTDPIDLGEVGIDGSRAAGGGPDIGTFYGGVAFSTCGSFTGVTYTTGTDGTDPDRMSLYEYLYKAYKILLGQRFDYVVPMDVYLDDKNVVDSDSFSASYLASITSGAPYPTAGSLDDILGRLYVEEYLGEYYFFWDLDGDGVAELYPDGVGAASGTTNIAGDALSYASFHEVNFAHQLAYFCHEVTVNHQFCLGSIGVRPPTGSTLAAVNVWLGKEPSYTTRTDGSQYILNSQSNGSGLLGNKWKAGKYGFRGSEAYGGFILTDTEFLDGSEEVDANSEPKDIGRYLSVVSQYFRYFNAMDRSGRGYSASACTAYLGFLSALPANEAPTNKVLRGYVPIIELSTRHVDRISGMGYVHAYQTPEGLTIADSPTGARPISDFRRVMTMKIIKACVGVTVARARAFLGKGFDNLRKNAMITSINKGLDQMVQQGFIVRYVLDVRQSRAQIPLGIASASLILVPAFELRRIYLEVSLQPAQFRW